MDGKTYLKIAATLSFVAALAHIAIIIGGADWYRFFGAGEAMAQLAESGSLQPAITTFLIALVLFIWGLYALSGAELIRRLPLLKPALTLISAIYCVRGVAGLILPFISSHPAIIANSVTFWLISSIICCVYGAFYFLGIRARWRSL